MEELIVAIRDLQAAQIAQSRVIRAIIASHPAPDALREAWHRYASPAIAEASTAQIADPERHAVHSALAQAMSDWDARLERDLQTP